MVVFFLFFSRLHQNGSKTGPLQAKSWCSTSCYWGSVTWTQQSSFQQLNSFYHRDTIYSFERALIIWVYKKYLNLGSWVYWPNSIYDYLKWHVLAFYLACLIIQIYVTPVKSQWYWNFYLKRLKLHV